MMITVIGWDEAAKNIETEISWKQKAIENIEEEILQLEMDLASLTYLKEKYDTATTV